MEKYTKTNKPCWNFLFSTIKTIKLHSASIKPVINQGFNFKWPQHAFALFGATKGRETIAACFAENCLVCFPALPLSNIIIIKFNKKVCLKTGGIKNIRSH